MTVVYVVIVNTAYEVVGVGTTEEQAITTACRFAYRWLRDSGALTRDTDTLAKVREFFGVTATRVTVGKATFAGST